MVSRRDLGKLALGALAAPAFAAAKINSVVRGVQLGMQSYIFNRLGLPAETLVDTVIATMVACGLGEVDFNGPVAGPNPTLDRFKAIREKFDNAGIDIYAMSGFPWQTDENVVHTFEIAEVLGARLITLTVTSQAAQRIVPLVEKSKFRVGIQGNPTMNPTNPDAICKPEQYEAAVALSPKFGMSLDIGDAVGGGYTDVVKFVETHHDRISLIYLKDRKRDRTSVPWGDGDTPVADVLRLVRDRKYAIRCYVDCDYRTTDRSADVKRSFDFAKKALAGRVGQ